MNQLFPLCLSTLSLPSPGLAQAHEAGTGDILSVGASPLSAPSQKDRSQLVSTKIQNLAPCFLEFN